MPELYTAALLPDQLPLLGATIGGYLVDSLTIDGQKIRGRVRKQYMPGGEVPCRWMLTGRHELKEALSLDLAPLRFQVGELVMLTRSRSGTWHNHAREGGDYTGTVGVIDRFCLGQAEVICSGFNPCHRLVINGKVRQRKDMYTFRVRGVDIRKEAVSV